MPSPKKPKTLIATTISRQLSAFFTHDYSEKRIWRPTLPLKKNALGFTSQGHFFIRLINNLGAEKLKTVSKQ